MTNLFQGKNGGVPFPRTEKEWIEKKMSQGVPYEDAQKEAQHRLCQDVFGHDYKVDAKGSPIETGRGSAQQSTVQHQQALARSAGARAAMRSKVGYTPALAGSFDPREGK
ncbi:hypothetical protein [Bradyrhizobium sp. dw_411]|uniref:hypothetical protein n=1 Tax=Bradyrhizobium sp. dw_411 TaxID=2720082 RepID=UPI001BD15436|nr:hypothetical protein [Bradyrhizobium sp. dw_411]